MKSLKALLMIGLATLWLVGCATSGREYDDRQIAQIKRDQTTETQLVDWFGPPNSRNVGPDGRSNLSWNFGNKTRGRQGALSVSLNPDGKVDSYSARTSSK